MRLVAAVVAASLLLLSGCAYLLDSPFPAYVPLLVDEQDVADEMPYEKGAHYELRVVSSPSGDYVWLFGEGGSFGKRFVLFDADLRRVLQGSENGDTFNGESLLAFGSGLLCIGKQVYNTAFVRQSDATWVGGWGYYDPDAGQFTFAYNSSADTVAWSGWAGPGTGEVSYSSGTISGYGSAGVVGLYHDVPGDRVAFYARVDSPLLVLGVVAPASGFPPSRQPILSSATPTRSGSSRTTGTSTGPSLRAKGR